MVMPDLCGYFWGHHYIGLFLGHFYDFRIIFQAMYRMGIFLGNAKISINLFLGMHDMPDIIGGIQ